MTNEELKYSVDIKRKVVLEDPYEKGLRKILNFGHTLGHTIETYSFSTSAPLLHGYAIALGIIGEAWLSYQVNGLSLREYEEIKKYISSVYKIDTSLYKDYTTIAAHMKSDKKNKGGRVMFSLLNEIGDCAFDIEVKKSLINAAIEESLRS